MAKNQPTGTYDPQTGAFIPAPKKEKIWPWIVLGVILVPIFSIVSIFGRTESTDAPADPAPAETEAAEPETDAPETEPEAEETAAPETEAPETEAPAPETDPAETEAPAPETKAPETNPPETEAPAPSVTPEPEPEEEKTSSGGLLSALFGGGKEKEPEVIPERGTPEWNEWWIEKYHINIMTSTKAALGNYYEYKEIKTPLDRSEWTISVFDSDDNFYASTKFTFQGRKYDVIFIGHLTINDKNQVDSWEGHYLYAEGKVLFDDGYTKDFWESIAEAAAAMNP